MSVKLNRMRRTIRREAGFTMAEVMVSLVVFIIAVVGLVATQARGVEAQQAAYEIREAERVGSQVMEDLKATNFVELSSRDFIGNATAYSGTAGLPLYQDTNTTATIANYGDVPRSDVNDDVPGLRPGFYKVWRRVYPVPSNAASVTAATGVQLEVIVMWIDVGNSQLNPLGATNIASIDPTYVTPGQANFNPRVRHVTLRTLKLDDRGPQP